ncbi:hypothetical protein ACJMK2_020057 [Sinanodonta woodiana]|uniref:Transporter n=1 Tax=Sinanodonta woodiana TaxID=1069815 RepID=A0ABD3TZL2_SINWO
MEEKSQGQIMFCQKEIDINAPEEQSLVGSSIIELSRITETGPLKRDSRYDETGEESGERAIWGGQLEFLLTCVAAAVGLGNVWRFPYLCYKNGGGAFLIPYTIMLAAVGLPLFYMELALGQFASLGPITIWRINPLFKGVGIAAVVINLIITLYYNVVVSHTVLYFFASMTSELPWTKCNNSWNSIYCEDGSQIDDSNSTQVLLNVTTRNTPSEEYFRYFVLEQSSSLDEFGTLNWKLALCLLFSWVVVWLVLLKGIQSLGKVVYFTAIFPYVMLTVLLIRGASLEGSIDGIIYYLKPDFSRLADPRVWSDAATQIFYSLSACTGGMVAMASYNKFTNNCYRDSLIVGIINCGTSVFAGFVIFSILGFMALEKGTTVDKVAADGPGLAFIVYPEALARMPVAPMWSVFFFLMMMTLGFGSEFSMVECVMSALADEYPTFLTSSKRRSFLYRTAIIIICFLLGLPMVCNGGMWLLNLVDYSISGFPLLFVGFLECIAINWIYGFNKFSEDIEMMIGYKPNIYWKICWKYITPLVTVATILFNMIKYKEPVLDGTSYSTSGLVVSWFISLAPIVIIIGWFLYAFCVEGGAWGLLKIVIQPKPDWGPANSVDRQRHVRYAFQDVLPVTCDINLLARLIGSNASDISANLQQLGVQAGSVYLPNLTPQLTPAASFIALQKANGSASQFFRSKPSSSSECSDM